MNDNLIPSRVGKYVSSILKNKDVTDQFIRNPLHGEIIELPGGNTVLLATDEGMAARDTLYYKMHDNVKFFQRVKVVRGKTGKARKGTRRLIMLCYPTEMNTQLELCVGAAFKWEDEHSEEEEAA